MKLDSNRTKALQAGDMFYEGTPCKKAGHTTRYTKTHICLGCSTSDVKYLRNGKHSPYTNIEKGKPRIKPKPKPAPKTEDEVIAQYLHNNPIKIY